MAETLKKLLQTKILVGRIDSIDDINGTLKVELLSQPGYKNFTIPSVFGGNDSWIRAYPQIDSFVLIGETEDDQYPEIIKVFNPSEKALYILDEGKQIDENPEKLDSVVPFDRIRKATNIATDDQGKIGFPYRRLKVGELEASSSGKASWWLGRNGELVLKGGLSKLEMDPFKNTIETSSAGHLKLGLDSTLDSQADQEYFGVVRRPVEDKNILSKISSINNRISKLDSLEISYERIADAIIDLNNIAVDSQNDFKISYDFAVKLVKEASLRTIVGFFSRLINNTEIYISYLNNLTEYTVTYVPDSPTLTSLKGGISELTEWKASIDAFLKRSNRPQDIGNDDVTLFNELKAEQHLKIPPSIDVKSISSTLSDEILALPLSTLKERKDGLKDEKRELESELNLQKSRASEIKSRHLNQSLIINPQAESDVIFAKEYRVNVSWKSSDDPNPKTLYEKIAGNVYDKEGNLEFTHGNELRSRETFFTQVSSDEKEDSTNIYVDIDGNMTTALAKKAVKGYTLTADSGDVKITGGKNFELLVDGGSSEGSKIRVNQGNLEISVGESSITLNSSGEIIFKAKSIKLDAGEGLVDVKGSAFKTTTKVNTTGSAATFGSSPVPIDPAEADKTKLVSKTIDKG